jgi:hypothetical protein
MSAHSPLVNCYYTQYAHIVKSTAPFSTMEFDRNLRLIIDLNDFPEFSRVRLWTPGMRQNAGMIRARAQIRSGTRKQAFLNHALSPAILRPTIEGVGSTLGPWLTRVECAIARR